jgi:FtsP/CotA-like multicopper oxidase with cupredoxin domain
LVGAGATIRWQLDPTGGLLFKASRALASIQAPQIWKPGGEIFTQFGFATPLPTFVGRRVTGTRLEIGMFEFQQRILPDALHDTLPAPFDSGSYVWGYAVRGDDNRPTNDPEDARPSYPGVTVEARKSTATTIKYINNLPENPVLPKYLTIDRTIHWADPLNQGHVFTANYAGPIPTVVHLHGAETQSTSDGAPEAWFTNNGLHGPRYSSLDATDRNAAIYFYPNNQQSATLWFHDHSLGITRINIFSGLAAFYFIRDQYDTGRADNPLRLPAGDQEIELLIQDRQFDTNGQLLWPDSVANPSLDDGAPSNPQIHPFWIPEFFGDVMVVNGRSWPFLNVEPRRYRFRILDGSNARFVRMGLLDSATINDPNPRVGPPIWQIGTDGGLLDDPLMLTGATEGPNPPPDAPLNPRETVRLLLAPAERADVIIDFACWAGHNLTLSNDIQVPFPSGGQMMASHHQVQQIMQFRVNLPLSGRDTTYNPASGQPLRGGPNQEPIIVRLANPAAGTLAAGVTPSVTRQLVLFEFDAPFGNGGNTQGTPVEVLVNNTKWNGRRDGGGGDPIPGSKEDQSGMGVWMTDLPRVGSTEVWEMLNMTMDAHPIHIHLVQFQLLNRQPVQLDPTSGQPTYMNTTWAAAFPGGTFNGETPDGTWGPVFYPKGTIIPGYGPPNNYLDPNADGALGGNPAFSSAVFIGPSVPPSPQEAGWKDTVIAFPGFVTRLVIRWAPEATPIDAVRPGQNLYSFDPTKGPGYLAHCHILDHEDNEMMRPYIPVP